MIIHSPHELVRKLEKFCSDSFEDFKEVELLFKSTTKNTKAKSLQSLLNAFEERLHATILFSWSLGVRANLYHFQDPVARTFLEVDSELYLHQNTLFKMPHYADAQRKIHYLCKKIPEIEYDAILEYFIYLETIGQKFSHYDGYLWANKYLSFFEAGYTDDYILTQKYTKALSEWFDIPIHPPYE